jgi:hypothetical protein
VVNEPAAPAAAQKKKVEFKRMNFHSPVNQELVPDGTTGVTFEEVAHHFK